VTPVADDAARLRGAFVLRCYYVSRAGRWCCVESVPLSLCVAIRVWWWLQARAPLSEWWRADDEAPAVQWRAKRLERVRWEDVKPVRREAIAQRVASASARRETHATEAR